MEIHRIFPGNDLPGVFMARGAARLAGAHGVKPGETAVVWAETQEAVEHARTLAAAGMTVAAVVTVLVVMFIAGVGIALGSYVYNYSNQVRDDVTIRAYLKDKVKIPII